jgi:hypothetical protein
MQDIRTGLAGFVNAVHKSSPTASIAIMEYSGAAILTKDFTSDTADLLNSCSGLFPSQQQTGVLFEAIGEASKLLVDDRFSRRAIVSIDINAFEISTLKPSVVATQVEDADASYWAVSFQRSGVDTSPARDALLTYLTEETGGLRFITTGSSSLESLLDRVASALTAQHLVTYQRPDGTGEPDEVSAGAMRGARILMATVAK